MRPRADVRSGGSGGRHSGRESGLPHVTLWSDQPMRQAEMGAGRSDDTSLIWEMPSGLMSNDLAASVKSRVQPPESEPCSNTRTRRTASLRSIQTSATTSPAPLSAGPASADSRSEEQTSELQSLMRNSYPV